MILSLISFLYLGPGLGGGALAAVLGILLSFLLGLMAILWYPFKKLIKMFRKKK